MTTAVSGSALEALFKKVLERSHPQDRIYIYRVHADATVAPAVFRGRPFPALLDILREQHGGGDFRLLIRCADRTILTGTLHLPNPTQD